MCRHLTSEVAVFCFFMFHQTESLNQSGTRTNDMKDLLSILQSGQANIKVEMDGEDLLEFSNDLINRAKSELAAEVAEAAEERYLTKAQAKEMCGNVCDATLWHWGRKGYLKPVKIGNKVRYRLSDIRRILDQKK